MKTFQFQFETFFHTRKWVFLERVLRIWESWESSKSDLQIRTWMRANFGHACLPMSGTDNILFDSWAFAHEHAKLNCSGIILKLKLKYCFNRTSDFQKFHTAKCKYSYVKNFYVYECDGFTENHENGLNWRTASWFVFIRSMIQR